MCFTLEDIGTQKHFEKTLSKLQNYHKELLEKINISYETVKKKIDTYFKQMI